MTPTGGVRSGQEKEKKAQRLFKFGTELKAVGRFVKTLSRKDSKSLGELKKVYSG